MASAATRYSLTAATLVAGLFAGGNIDRGVVAMPAWQQVGPTAWSVFSRDADLGNGLLLYPLEGIGGALLALLAAGSFYFDRTASRAAAVPIYGALALATTGLLLTLRAAPIMFSVRDMTEPSAPQHAFEGFYFWGSFRGICQVLAFCADIWAFVALLPRRE